MNYRPRKTLIFINAHENFYIKLVKSVAIKLTTKIFKKILVKYFITKDKT